MLVTVTIMLILVAAAATAFRPATEDRRIREAARAINVYLGSARNRAMETGRPCGVTFRAFVGLTCAMNADQCEVPPCYAGVTEQSVAVVSNPVPLTAVLYPDMASMSPPENILPDLVKQNDLIQFNNQGPLYRITNANDFPVGAPVCITSNTLQLVAADPAQNPIIPWTGQRVPFRIFRAPTKGMAQPLQLPAASVVDLQATGHGTAVAGANDFTVLFAPNGSVEAVYYGANRWVVTEPIYLLVGKRERVGNTFVQDNADATTLTNYQDLNNLWVVINPQTGAINTDSIANSAGTTSEANAVLASRTLAAEAQGIGGK